MKKLHSILLAALVMLAGCGEINDRLDVLEGRVDDIENTQIATISQQITSINNSILLLNGTDKELKDYIAALEAEAEALEAKLAETNTKIDNMKNELSETISTEKAAILAELEAFKATVNGELEAIKATLETLKAKDTELEGQIATLETYVDESLATAKDWATATFATLEQYNTIVETIAIINGQIEGLNQSIADLESRINEKIAEDIETACATLSADLQTAVEEVTEAYTAAISDTKEAMTEAYTTALENANAELESSMKEWVNEQLTSYSTIADTEAKITALQSEMDGKLAAQKTYLEALVNALSASVTTDITAIKKQIEEVNEAIAKNAEEIAALREELAAQKEEITEAYTTAIAAAIAESEGKMSDELAKEVAAINERIDQSDVAAIEALVANCKERMTTLEADVAQLKADVLQLQTDVEELQEITEKLLAQIQSITYIPTYADGKATIDYHTKRGTLDFQISPKSAITDLEKVWETALSFKAVHTKTRAVTFIDLPITAFEADAANGTITIEVDGTNLGDDFFVEQANASATLEVSDGNNCINSPYINLSTNFLIHFEDPEVERLCVRNWDTDGDGKLSYAEAAAVTDIGTVFTNSYYDEGNLEYIPRNLNITTFKELQYFVGLETIPAKAFDNMFLEENYLRIVCLPPTIKSIDSQAFYGCIDLQSIDIPQGVESIGSHAFYSCSKLTNITIPDGVAKIEYATFSGCTSLTSVTIPDSVTEIGSSAFSGCSSLASVYCMPTTPPSGENNMFSENASWRKIYVPTASVSAYKTAKYWSNYASYIVAYDF